MKKFLSLINTNIDSSTTNLVSTTAETETLNKILKSMKIKK